LGGVKLKVDVREIVESLKKEIEKGHNTAALLSQEGRYFENRMSEYKKQENIVIFGAGNYGRTLYKMLDREGMGEKVCCFCDNSIVEGNSNFNGVEILSVNEAYSKYPKAFYIITPRMYENEILRQLVKLGVGINNISIFTMSYLEGSLYAM
jgi:FlaA1/EpsC-like NDP-sugar epimerase